MQRVNCKPTSTTGSLKSSTFHTTTTKNNNPTSVIARRIKTPGLTMSSFWTVCFFILVSAYLISARPSSNLNRFKRQSDQRIAELETLLALEKYGARRDMNRNDLHYPAYGIIDFAKIGRKKKSTRFSPGFVPEPSAGDNVMNVNQEPDLSDLTLPSGWFSKFERHPLHRRNPVGHDHFDTEK